MRSGGFPSFGTKVAPDCTSHPSGCCYFLLGPPNPSKGASVVMALTRSSQSPLLVSSFSSSRAEEMAWSLKCVPWEQEDMSLVSRTHEGEPEEVGMVVKACNSRTGEVETGRAWGLAGQPPKPVGKVPCQQETVSQIQDR